MSPVGAYPTPFATQHYPCGSAPSHVWMAAGLTLDLELLIYPVGESMIPYWESGDSPFSLGESS
jgi:hypothetical protein